MLRNQLEQLYSIRKEIGVGPPWALFHKFFIILHRKKNLKQNDVEFDFSIGHALVLFPFFFNNKEKMYGGICTSARTHQNSYILIYFGPKTLFSPNLMIIVTGTFRNTSNYMK